MSRQLKRTKAQRRWRRKGYTHEVGWWSAAGKPENFILAVRADTASYFRKNPAIPGDDYVRPICQQFIHKGRKP